MDLTKYCNLLRQRRWASETFTRQISFFSDMGLPHVASIGTLVSARFLRKVRHKHRDGSFTDILGQVRWSRSSCNSERYSTGNLRDRVLRREWQEQLHQGAILALLLRHTPTEQNAENLALVSTSTDAQLLMTCFGEPATVGANLEVVERCALYGLESGSLIFSLEVAPQLDILITGHATRELRLWRLKDFTPILGPALGGHTGWVRTLAVGNKLMLSAACNFIKVWNLPDTSDARVTNSTMIEHLGDLQLFKGDVLVTAIEDDCIYAATANGMLHMWIISQALTKLSINSLHKRDSVQAHEGVSASNAYLAGRITSLVLHNNVVITAGHDGHIRVWCKSTLQMKAEAIAAHKSAKLHALASTSTFLFSGGDDKCVRVWDPETLAPIGDPVQAHASGVRSLAAVTSSYMPSSVQTTSPVQEKVFFSTVWLVSGDAHGEVALWRFVIS